MSNLNKKIGFAEFENLYNSGFYPIPLSWDAETKQCLFHPEHREDIQPGNGKPNLNDIARWYNKNGFGTGMALALYPPFFMIDFDLKNSSDKTIFDNWLLEVKRANEDILTKLCIEKTRSSGYHVYGKYKNISHQVMLARNEQGKEVISIKAGALLSYCYPTPGYELIHNEFADIDFLTDDEFDLLSSLSRPFNKYKPKETEFQSGETVSYPEEWEEILSQFDRRCTEGLFEELLNIIDLYPTNEKPKTKIFVDKEFPDRKTEVTYHYYLRSGSTNRYSAKVSFGPKKVFIFSASFPGFPNFHNRAAGESYGLTPSMIIYYSYEKDWIKTVEIIKQLCSDHNIPIDEMPPPPDHVEDTSVRNEYVEKFRTSILSQEKNYPPPVAVVNIIQRGEAIPLLTLKGFSLWQGKQKTKKTIALAVTAAAFITDNPDPYLQAAIGRGTVLFFDTEQGGYAPRTMKLILKLANLETSSRLVYCDLREYTPSERMKIIAAGIESTPETRLVIIDGLVDLLTDFMDAKDGHTCVTEILRLCSRFDIHVAGVLHQNKADKNARAHIGSIASQKCEMEISTEIDPDDRSQSIVECVNSRGLPFEKFAIRWDKGSLPMINAAWNEGFAWDKKASKNYEDGKQLAQDVFKPLVAYSFSEAIAAIRKENKKSESTAKRLIKDFCDWGFIDKGNDGKYRIRVQGS